jgi:predicted MFS family arabinose efflux permease
LASPYLARRFGLVRSVVWSELCSIPFFVILAFSQSFWLSVAAFLLRGALMNLPYPLYGNFIMRMVKPEERERANALTKFAWNISWVVTSRLAGMLLEGERPDYASVMMTTAGFYLLASASFWTFFRKSGH